MRLRACGSAVERFTSRGIYIRSMARVACTLCARLVLLLLSAEDFAFLQPRIWPLYSICVLVLAVALFFFIIEGFLTWRWNSELVGGSKA